MNLTLWQNFNAFVSEVQGQQILESKPNHFKYCQLTSQKMSDFRNINCLPAEILLLIFRHLNFGDVAENCAKTCAKWRDIVAIFHIKTHIRLLGNMDEDVERVLHDWGWHENVHNVDEIITTFNKIREAKGKN